MRGNGQGRAADAARGRLEEGDGTDRWARDVSDWERGEGVGPLWAIGLRERNKAGVLLLRPGPEEIERAAGLERKERKRERFRGLNLMNFENHTHQTKPCKVKYDAQALFISRIIQMIFKY